MKDEAGRLASGIRNLAAKEGCPDIESKFEPEIRRFRP